MINPAAPVAVALHRRRRLADRWRALYPGLAASLLQRALDHGLEPVAGGAIGGTTLAILGAETGNAGEWNLDSSVVSIQTSDTPGVWSRACFLTTGANRGPKHSFTAQADLNVLWRGKCTVGPGTIRRMLLIADNGTVQVSLAQNAAGNVVAYRGDLTTVLGTGTGVYSGGVWHHFEIRAKISDTVGEIQVWVNGRLEINLTAQDTKADATIATVSIIQAYFGNAGDKVDDVVVIASPNGTPPQAGEVAVAGLLPSAAGDATQLATAPTGSPTRMYLSTRAPEIFPAFDAAWELTNPGNIGSLTRGKDGSALAQLSSNSSGATSGQDVAIVQLVSDELKAQTISGTIKGQIRASEASTFIDGYAQLVIRVVSKDGSTVRGTLLAAHSAVLSSEFATALTNRKFPLASLSPATLTSVTALDGDRIVVEVGYREGATSSGACSVQTGAPVGTSDLPEDETTTTALVPWLQFSGDLQFNNYSNVDEPPVDGATSSHDADASYVQSSTLNDRDLYNFEDLSAELTTVGAVGVFLVARKVDAGPGSITAVVKSGVTEAAGADKAVAASYQVIPVIFDVDPTDTLAWSRAKVNALQAGPKIR